MNDKPVIDLGCITFANPKPPEYLAHLDAELRGEAHDVQVTKSGRCITDCVCKTCGIAWSTDTGD